MSANATEYRSFCPDPHVEVRKAGDKQKILLLASVFNKLSEDLGGYREIIRPGAFDATLEDVAAGTRDVAARVQHDGGMTTIGRNSNGTLKLWTDDRGLWAEITPPDTQVGRDITKLVEDRYINKASFAFMVRPGGVMWHTSDESELREILDVDLYDVAPVDGPAYPDTVAETRSAQAPGIKRERELAMRGLVPTRDEIKATLQEELHDAKMVHARIS